MRGRLRREVGPHQYTGGPRVRERTFEARHCFLECRLSLELVQIWESGAPDESGDHRFIEVVDHHPQVELPGLARAVEKRYNHDGYGQRHDGVGAALSSAGVMETRPWPLGLSGEPRPPLELAAPGHDGSALHPAALRPSFSRVGMPPGTKYGPARQPENGVEAGQNHPGRLCRGFWPT